MKTKTHWVLIADGARARIVRVGGTFGEKAADMAVFEIDHKRLGEIMSDRPGRSFASEGTRRSAMEYHSEPEKEQEARFAATLLDELERRLAAHEFEELTIVAEPRMLGVLREKISPALRRTVVAEIAKDLTNIPAPELGAALAGLDIR